MTYKEMLEKAVAENMFSLDACLDVEGNISENITDTFEALRKKLAPRVYKGFKSAIVRSSFFIGLTNPGTGTDSTKYRVRWVEVLKTQKDVRYATYEQCVAICEKVVTKIVGLPDEQLKILMNYCSNSIFNFELPIDYIDRLANPFHAANNVDIFITPAIERCTQVRELIKDKSLNPKADIFKKIMSKKIKKRHIRLIVPRRASIRQIEKNVGRVIRIIFSLRLEEIVMMLRRN